MNSKQTEADYVPYGPEWEKEMSKFPKPKLIKMLGKAYQEKKELKQSLPSKPVGDVEESGYASAPQKGMRWVKASDNKFPTVKGNYFLRHFYEDGRVHGWWAYIVPEAIDKNYWIKMGYEYLDESPSPSEAGDGWIRVEDGLPQDRERVLVFKYTRQIKEALFIKKDEWDRDNQFIIGGAYYDIQKWITHWRPLPAPPIQKTVK